MIFKFMFMVFFLQFSIVTMSDASERNCTLDYPSTVLNNGTFKINKENGISTEYIQIDEGVNLYIEIDSCHFLTTKYKFMISKPYDVGGVIGFEYRKSIDLLNITEKKLNGKIDFSEAKMTIQKYLDLVTEPKLNEELYIRKNFELSFSEKIWIDADLHSNIAKFEVTISSGPY